jgi:hypothetical protein
VRKQKLKADRNTHKHSLAFRMPAGGGQNSNRDIPAHSDCSAGQRAALAAVHHYNQEHQTFWIEPNNTASGSISLISILGGETKSTLQS